MSSTPVRRADPLVGTELDGRYRIEQLIGRGGMASVYRATDVTLGRIVAVKLFETPSDELDGDQRRRSEVALLASISHRSLVTLFDAARDEATGRDYFAMEYIEGDDLAHRLRRGPVTGADAAALLVGTAAYLSPEQVSGSAPAPSCDIYSLGLIVLEAMTCERAFPGSPMESAAARLRRDPEIPSAVPEEWAALLRAMTAREPGDRPTALEVSLRAEQLHPSGSGDDEHAEHATADVRTQSLDSADKPTAPDAPTAVLAAANGSVSPPANSTAEPTGNAVAHSTDSTEPVARPSREHATAWSRDDSAAPRTPAVDPQPDPPNRRRPLLWIGLVAIAAAVVAGAVLVPPLLVPAAEPPELPSVPGELGVHLDELMDSVTP